MCLVVGHGSRHLGLVATDTLIREWLDDGGHRDERREDKLASLPTGWAVVRGDAHLGADGLRALRTAPPGTPPQELGSRIRRIREEVGSEILSEYPESPFDETDWIAVYATDASFQALQIDSEGNVKPGKTILGAPPAGVRADVEPDVALRDEIARKFLPRWRAARTVADHVRAVAFAFAYAAGHTDGMSDEVNMGVMTRNGSDVGSVSLLAPAAEVIEATDREIEARFEPGHHLRRIA